MPELPFHYSPLKEGEVRLLELLPERTEIGPDPILCNLNHVSLHDLPRYEALSYSWGTDTNDRIIYINGCTKTVKINLYSALQRFRKTHPGSEESSNTPRTFWIDAICINQDDSAERAHQVPLMSTIYSRPWRLVVWLGEEDANSRIAVRFLREIQDQASQNPEQLDSWLAAVNSREDYKAQYLALLDFLARSWFQRSWILQEFALGSQESCHFQAGGDIVPISTMNRLEDYRNSSNWARWEDSDEKQAMWAGLLRWTQLRVAKARYQDRYEPRTTLLSWLASVHDAEATDPRDKVYSVLGIVDLYNRGGEGVARNAVLEDDPLIIDYQAPVEDVYSSVVRSAVANSGKLNVLLACSESEITQRTWTPDWIQRPGNLCILGAFYEDVAGTCDFRASKELIPVASFAEDNSAMTVRGILWDTVLNKCQPPRENSRMRDKVFRKIFWKALTCLEFAPETVPYRSEELIAEALWCSVIQGGGDKIKSRAELEKFGLDERSTDLSDFEQETIQDSIWRPYRQQRTWATPEFLSRLIQAPRIYRYDQRLIVTERGYLGKSFCSDTQIGDAVCILLGLDVPMILRKVDSHYVVVGGTYLHGVMSGEAIEALDKGEVHLQDFELR